MKRLTLALLALSLTACGTLTKMNIAAGNSPDATYGPVAQALITKLSADAQRTKEMAEAAGDPIGAQCGESVLVLVAILPANVGPVNGILSLAEVARLTKIALEGPAMLKAKDSCAPLGVNVLRLLRGF